MRKLPSGPVVAASSGSDSFTFTPFRDSPDLMSRTRPDKLISCAERWLHSQRSRIFERALDVNRKFMAGVGLFYIQYKWIFELIILQQKIQQDEFINNHN
jgi:hypothetical protein